MFGRIVTVTGWTWEYVRDEFDLRGLRRMYRYWDDHPPLHELVAGFMGIGSKKRTKTKSSSSLREFASELGASGFRGMTKTRAR